MAITINDVAALAGVSKSTVSKVLNGWTTISPETCTRIYNAIEELGYVPNQRAVNFAKQNTKNIVYLANLAKDSAYQNPHMFDIMCGVNSELSKENFTMSLVDISTETHPGERAIVEINKHSTDGLIIHGSAVNQKLAKIIVEKNIPHIIIGNPSFENRLCWVDTDHALAGETAAEHIIDCGYKDICFVGGKKSDEISNARKRGLQRGLLKSGNRLMGDRIIYTDSTRTGAYIALRDFLETETLPNVIVCENNTLTLGVVKLLNEKGIDIPNDVGLITFDLYPYSTIVDPTLTVVDIDMFDMGIQAGNMMIRKLSNPDLLVQSFTTLPKLIVGTSTKKPEA